MPRGKFSPYNKCYKSAYDLDRLVKGLYRLENDSIELDKKQHAKEITKEEADKYRAGLETGKRNLEKKKVKVLNDIIFPSMANLTVLLEYMVKSPSIDKLFEKDLKALFFAKSALNEHRNVFERFIEALSKITRKRRRFIPASDYRLILCDIMQESITYAMVATGTRKFHHEQFVDHTLLPDMNRAYAWTSEIAEEPRRKLHFDKKKRPPQF